LSPNGEDFIITNRLPIEKLKYVATEDPREINVLMKEENYNRI